MDARVRVVTFAEIADAVQAAFEQQGPLQWDMVALLLDTVGN